MKNSGLTSLPSLPVGITHIGSGWFAETLIPSVVIPGHVKEIGVGAFSGCPLLTSVTIPGSVSRVGDKSFYGCRKLSSIIIEDGVTSIGAGAFASTAYYNTPIDHSWTENLIIPSSVNYVGWGAFCLFESFSSWNATIKFKGKPPIGIEDIAMENKSSYYPANRSKCVSILYNFLNTTAWTQIVNGSKFKSVLPYDPNGGVVTGNVESGYIITPSEDRADVDVTIPEGIEPEKVTVIISAGVTTIKPNGAKLRIMSGGYNITDYLNIPSIDANGSIDLTKAAVKEEIVKEAMDPSKGAVIDITASSPALITSETKSGLTYTFAEGTTLESLTQKSSKVGDGKPWTPTITIKGGASGFYSIGVTK